jgi:hypothetical protein
MPRLLVPYLLVPDPLEAVRPYSSTHSILGGKDTRNQQKQQKDPVTLTSRSFACAVLALYYRYCFFGFDSSFTKANRSIVSVAYSIDDNTPTLSVNSYPSLVISYPSFIILFF